jgi:hypothetical protein
VAEQLGRQGPTSNITPPFRVAEIEYETGLRIDWNMHYCITKIASHLLVRPPSWGQGLSRDVRKCRVTIQLRIHVIFDYRWCSIASRWLIENAAHAQGAANDIHEDRIEDGI